MACMRGGSTLQRQLHTSHRSNHWPTGINRKLMFNNRWTGLLHCLVRKPEGETLEMMQGRRQCWLGQLCCTTLWLTGWLAAVLGPEGRKPTVCLHLTMNRRGSNRKASWAKVRRVTTRARTQLHILGNNTLLNSCSKLFWFTVTTSSNIHYLSTLKKKGL